MNFFTHQACKSSVGHNFYSMVVIFRTIGSKTGLKLSQQEMLLRTLKATLLSFNGKKLVVRFGSRLITCCCSQTFGREESGGFEIQSNSQVVTCLSHCIFVVFMKSSKRTLSPMKVTSISKSRYTPLKILNLKRPLTFLNSGFCVGRLHFDNPDLMFQTFVILGHI